jgi:hypothetical protein
MTPAAMDSGCIAVIADPGIKMGRLANWSDGTRNMHKPPLTFFDERASHEDAKTRKPEDEKTRRRLANHWPEASLQALYRPELVPLPSGLGFPLEIMVGEGEDGDSERTAVWPFPKFLHPLSIRSEQGKRTTAF